MKFLIQGIGSIGQRHYKNVRAVGHEAAILRTTDAKRPFVHDFFESQKKEGNEPQVFYSLESAVSEFAPDALIIANPNHMHLRSALEAAHQGLHLFIEKPLHNVPEGIGELEQLVEEKKLVAMVGYNMRFHPLLVRVKNILDSGEAGEVISAAVEVGENIIDWHPWEDYRETYAPWKRSGGGALLCFSHDIDYLYWLLGKPSTVHAAGGKITPLEGDAEDLVEALWKYKDGPVVNLHIDYWQRPKVRTLKILGEKKTLLWDAYANLTIWNHETGEKVVEEVPAGFERNTMFVDEIKHFVHCIETEVTPFISITQGKEVLDIITKMKASLDL